MKVRAFLVFLLFVHVRAVCQEVTVSYKNGKPFNASVAVLREDTCLFYLDDGASADWTLSLDKESGREDCANVKGSRFFMINADMYGIDWKSAKRYVQDGDSSTYYKGIVSCKAENFSYDQEVYFNLLPSKPEISEPEFIYDRFDYEYLMFENARLNVLVSCSRSEGFCATNTDFWLDGMTYDDRLFLYTFRFDEDNEAAMVRNMGDDEYFLSTNSEWGQYIYFFAENKYGKSQPSDTLFTTDLIKDTSVTDAINGTSGLKAVSEPPRVSIKEGVLCLSTEADTLRIYDIMGTEILRDENCSGMPLCFLPRGIYVISVTFSGNERITKKIIL